MKICTRCKKEKSLQEFSKQKRGLYGVRSYCRLCSSDLWKEHYTENHEHYIKKARLDTITHKEERSTTFKLWYERTKKPYYRSVDELKKHLAREMLRDAIKAGRIMRKPCEQCGATSVDAHHYDGYEKNAWYTVRWLCKTHHNQQHRKYSYD